VSTAKMPIGVSSFEILREQGYYYVDKSQFVAEVAEAAPAILLLPRPRRFGKTLNMTMLQAWYEKKPDGSNITHLFNGLRAETLPGAHQTLKGKLPVIFLTFKDIKKSTWEATQHEISLTVASEVRRLSPWFQKGTIHPDTLTDLQTLGTGASNDALLTQSLKFLTLALHLVSGERPLLLIDEYDAPIHAALTNGFFKEAIDFFRNFLSAGLKDNAHISKGVLTGILRVSKENIFSGLNNITVNSLVDEEFETCFGLLESEVETCLRDSGITCSMEDVRSWYNGYLFGRQTIYNPWSVIRYATAPSKGLLPHWVNTASNDIVGLAISDSQNILRAELETLLAGGEVEKQIDSYITFDSTSFRPTDVWSFLLFTGYLKLTRPIENREGRLWGFLAVPNREVRLAFTELVEKWCRGKFASSETLAAMLSAFVDGNEDVFERHFSRMVRDTLSFHDVYEEHAEAFYHAFVVGLLVNLESTHTVRSNRESGYGRSDVMLIPKNPAKHAGVVVEFKTVRKKETPEAALAAAWAQITEKQYVSELQAHGCARITKWAIAFRGKEVFLNVEQL
jgi:hypothetical protein